MSDEHFDKPGDLTEAMRDGLARAYGISGFRDYLLFTIRAANRNAMTLIQAGKSDEAKDFAVRMRTLEEFMAKARICYERMDEMKRQRKMVKKLSTQQESLST